MPGKSGSPPRPGTLLSIMALAVGMALLAAAGGEAQEPAPPQPPARLSGSGKTFSGTGLRVRHSVNLFCDASSGPNRIELHWGSRSRPQANRFVLTSTTTSGCSDHPRYSAGAPATAFDTHQGYGEGVYNGAPGYALEWAIVDNGEPGARRDRLRLAVRDAADRRLVLSTHRFLGDGNYDAGGTPQGPLLAPPDMDAKIDDEDRDGAEDSGFSNTPGSAALDGRVRNPTPPSDVPPQSGPNGPSDGGCTISLRGTRGADSLRGTPLGDRVRGLSGNDKISSLAGTDCVSGGGGRDALSAGPGNDRVAGDSGNDRLSGGTGNDRLTGGTGRDLLKGGAGRNALAGGPGNDRIAAVNGERDTINCGSGRDRVSADRIDRVKRCERVRRSSRK